MRKRELVGRRGLLCDTCMNWPANVLATLDGATAPAPAGAEQLPPECDCGAVLVPVRTDYGRWVYLTREDHPAEPVRGEYWRVVPHPVHHQVAVRVFEPRPGEPLRTRHESVCPAAAPGPAG
ncbi:hypothetical protein [Streptomyces sclerotialus]|uniref:hypothetical protein n=1 Tax=Streptomyces sclerotialus TaxID=1957 RepID=UPI00068E8C20